MTEKLDREFMVIIDVNVSTENLTDSIAVC